MKIKRSIIQTLFVVVTGVALVVVISMALMISLSLEQGFKDHIHTTELSHMTAVEKTLVYYYQKTGDWQFLQSVGPDFASGMGQLALTVPEIASNPEQGSKEPAVGAHDFEVLGQPRPRPEQQPNNEFFPVAGAESGNSAAPQADGPFQSSAGLQGGEQREVPEADGPRFDNGWMPVPDESPAPTTIPEHQVLTAPPVVPQSQSASQAEAVVVMVDDFPAGRGQDGQRHGPGGGGRNDLASIGQRMAVLDADKHVVGGHLNPVLSPLRAIYITSDKGERQLIGYLALARPIVSGRILTDGEDANQRFINEQMRHIMWISLLAVIMSAVAALLLAQHFRQPIKELADGARKVAEGDFTIRLPVKRKDELGEVAQDFNQMAEQLGAFERSRRQWVADTSHELRTPITILSTHLEAMADGVIPTNPERLGVLAHTVADMNRLVGDLHQLASADAGARDYQFQPVEVSDLLSDLQQAFTARLQQHKLSLSVVDQTPIGLRIEADRMRLTQVLSNLLTNSGRYTDAGGHVRIMATAQEQQLKLVVEDSAPGVPAEALPKLFDRFYRVDASRSRQNGGSGLGLAICQAIIDAHNGAIVASASLLGGLRVEISLPLSRTGQVTA